MKKTILTLAIYSASIWASNVEPARVTKYTNVSPQSLGQAARAQGTVELQLDIDANGKLKGTRIVKGRPDLVPAAVKTVRDWQFAPAQVDGRAVNSKFNVVLDFEFGKRS
jgi:TonB family protein